MGKGNNQVALVFGASRGIGRQICLSLAAEGYFVVLSSKSTGLGEKSELHDPNSQSSTISTVLREVEQAGGQGAAIACDVRFEEQVNRVITQVMSAYKQIDVLIYNPGAIWWSAVDTTPTKRYQLMHSINTLGLYTAIQALLPIFKRQKRGRIISVSPPIYSRFMRGKAAYAMTKIAASVMTIGLGMDFTRKSDYREHELAISSIWPAAAIQSAATFRADPSELRQATIFGDAILAILSKPVGEVNGQLFLDEDFLRRQCSYTDEMIDRYAVVPGTHPRRIMPAVLPDLTVAEQDDQGSSIDQAQEKSSKL